MELRHIKGMKWNAVADVIGTNENAVKQTYSRYLRSH